MTLEQFFDDLAADPAAWQLVDGGMIRACVGTDAKDGWHCPLTYLQRHNPTITPSNGGLKAAEAMGLPRDTAFRIIAAADGYSKGSYVRAALLKACGLPAESAEVGER